MIAPISYDKNDLKRLFFKTYPQRFYSWHAFLSQSSNIMHILKRIHMHMYSAWSISVPWGCRQAPAAMVSGCRSVQHNVEELPEGSTWAGRTMEPQRRRSGRGHGKPICQPGRAARSSPASDLPPARTMEGGRSRARGNGGEFPAFYNKMESSILVTIGIGHSQATPRIC